MRKFGICIGAGCSCWLRSALFHDQCCDWECWQEPAQMWRGQRGVLNCRRWTSLVMVRWTAMSCSGGSLFRETPWSSVWFSVRARHAHPNNYSYEASSCKRRDLRWCQEWKCCIFGAKVPLLLVSGWNVMQVPQSKIGCHRRFNTSNISHSSRWLWAVGWGNGLKMSLWSARHECKVKNHMCVSTAENTWMVKLVAMLCISALIISGWSCQQSYACLKD